ncbi:MAG: DNA ligase D [Alphaproteobacteria bacterium]|nr:MAG: DNA ligase D [Alphaproteobacteria bacterium]
MRKQSPALETYRKKRSFDVTAEPPGGQLRHGGNAFVIQKHAATRLHYDLRLELDGVMKSWAVTRGPSLVPGEKRLAVHVEDHPIEYNDFEGTIPKGQYGGGTVLIWDRGQWFPEGDPRRAYAKGSLDFRLEGHKLKGRWHLVRMRKRPGERQEPWLLIKSKDEAARGPNDPDILEEKPRSVVSRRTIEGIAQANDAVWQSNRSVGDNVKTLRASAKKKAAKAAPRKVAKSKTKAKSRAQLARSDVLREKPKRTAKGSALPAFIPPQLATLHDKAPNDPSYVHEAKFDGYRLQARLDHGKVKLLTRKALDWTDKFKPVAQALAELETDTAIVDGEVVVEENGVSDFSALQDALKHHKANFVYYAFDLLHLDGADLTAEPLIARKAALKKLLDDTDPNGIVRYSDHFEISGTEMLDHACQLDLEGVISKRRDAPYRPGRSDDWIKSKCQQNQEFVIIGYKDASHLKGAVGALVLGYYDNGSLKYAGRSGTGYTMETARDVWKKLQPLRRDKPAFGALPQEERGRKGIWVEPKRVAEITFRGWTAQGHIRHAVFKGLREDKSASEVVRERPMPTKPKAKSAGRAKPAKAGPSPRKTAAKSSDDGAVKFTHPDRIYWTDVEITKQQLADYYTSVWDYMAPHVVQRPMALVRCPEGVGGQCFFQKHAAAGLVSERIRRKRDGHGEELIYIDDLDGLLTLVQAGVLEIHVWGSTIDDIEHCNRIVFDLDPGDDVPWAAVNRAARELRERLGDLKLKSFVKTTGGKGLHVVLPTDGTPWDEAKDFAHAMVLAMAADAPDRYVTKMTKSIRGGKIFLDYLRNGRGATAIVAYSTRARAGATVSAPVSWDELGPKLTPNKFTVLNIGKRLASLKKDPWADIGKVKQRLPDLAALKKRV